MIEAKPPPATLLELGAGCGRITRPLVEANYTVTAVDNSTDMLSHIDYAETVVSDIESLRLETCFDFVLLASRIFNCPDREVRELMLDTARRHLDKGGILLLEIHSPSILTTKVGESGANEHYSATIISSAVNGNRAAITIEYRIDEDVWRHSFDTEYLPPDSIESVLEQHGFELDDWLDSEMSWVRAIAV